jgi:hypothetical protein
MAEQNFHVGDTRRPAVAILQEELEDGTVQPVNLSGLTGVTFTMVNARSPYAVKVDAKPATIISDGTGGQPAKVMYEWTAQDVNVKGVYFAWFTLHDGGATEHFPVAKDYFIIFHPSDGTDPNAPF